MAARREPDRGQVAPYAVIAAVVAMLLLAFSVDLGTALATSARQNSDVQVFREEVESAGPALAVKNADDPALEIAQRAAASMRRQGFDGFLAVYVEEAPAGWEPEGWSSGLAPGKRLIGYAVVACGDSPAVFSRLVGMEGFPVVASQAAAIVPYSSGRAWRPASSGRRCYVADAGSAAVRAGSGSEAGERFGVDDAAEWASVEAAMAARTDTQG